MQQQLMFKNLKTHTANLFPSKPNISSSALSCNSCQALFMQMSKIMLAFMTGYTYVSFLHSLHYEKYHVSQLAF